MHETLFSIYSLDVTGWKLVGYIGVLMFGGRWLVQAAFSHMAKRPILPRMFWYMSLVGAMLTLMYFIYGKNDSVGILGYLFPSVVAIYNLILDSRHRRQLAAAEAQAPAPVATV